jgi:hypothetical protein
MAYDYSVLTPQFVLNRFLYGGDPLLRYRHESLRER